MAGLSLAGGTTNLRSVMRNLCFEQSGDTGLFSTTQIDDFLNLAHQTLWGEIAEISPSWFAVRSADITIGSSGYAISGTALDADGFHSITRVEIKYDTADYVPLAYLDFQETRLTTGPSADSAASAANYQGWYFIGDDVHLYPTPATNQTIRITFVPAAYSFTTGSSVTTDFPFDRLMPNYDDTVAYLAATMALEKDEVSEHIRRRYDIRHKNLIDHVRRRQTSKARAVIQTESGWD